MISPLFLLLPLVAATPASDWLAPTHSDHLVPRLSRQTTRVFSNLRYESNNLALRATDDPQRPRCADAKRTRELAARTAGLFVLRDSLFSQQDHPVQHLSCALMMPPNWVSVAVDDALAGRPTAPVIAPETNDDDAWSGIDTPTELFGGFPQSESLHKWATTDLRTSSAQDRRRINNAREAIRTLKVAGDRLIEASGQGPEAVAAAGAELIAQSDREYFGANVRRDAVIPLFVEHPSEHEIVDEGKGLVVHGRALSDRALDITQRAVYGRRLEDGPMALERYDLTRETDVQRAAAVLQKLVPKGSRGHHVYVWVGGPLIAGTERVADASDQIPAFLAVLHQADIEMSRVTVFARPVFQSRGKTGDDLRAGAARARQQGVLYGVNMMTEALRSRIGWQ